MLEWSLGNAVGHHNARGNFYPREARPEQTIDSAAALIMVLGRAISGQACQPDANDCLARQPVL
jgi:phage terminase large subunit-like protein